MENKQNQEQQLGNTEYDIIIRTIVDLFNENHSISFFESALYEAKLRLLSKCRVITQ